MGFRSSIHALPLVPASLRLPNDAELAAYRMRRRDGLTDVQIAERQGVARETANRRRHRAQRLLRELDAVCGGDCNLVDGLLRRELASAR